MDREERARFSAALHQCELGFTQFAAGMRELLAMLEEQEQRSSEEAPKPAPGREQGDLGEDRGRGNSRSNLPAQ